MDPSSQANSALARTDSISHTSESSQTAQDFIRTQLQLEAEAREALPYQFDTCTKALGPLRQSVFACLTCTPPPASPAQHFTPAGVCYSCSISCHGEHNLVELFSKRDFVCDCGTTRISSTPCSLRMNEQTGRKGGVAGEQAREGNKYNQNFAGRFCGCGEEYDPEKEKGTMFQCLGLGHLDDGGCGEDWWHPECLMGLPRVRNQDAVKTDNTLEPVKEEGEDASGEPATTNRETVDFEEPPLPAGFPQEDDFDHLICYKCANAYPWVKQYAGTPGFLPAVPADGSSARLPEPSQSMDSKKRKAEDDVDETPELKKIRSEEAAETEAAPQTNGHVDNESLNSVKAESTTATNGEAKANAPKHASLPPAPTGNITLFLHEDFRDHLCRCPECFPRLAKHPQLLEEEESYEPPLSDSGDEDNASVGGRSAGTGSLLERGEAALSNMDRVRAIEGVMAYNHVRDKVKTFLQPFAESGQAVGAEDIKAYFEKLRGDEQAIREAAVGASNGGVEGDHRREQGGY